MYLPKIIIDQNGQIPEVQGYSYHDSRAIMPLMIKPISSRFHSPVGRPLHATNNVIPLTEKREPFIQDRLFLII